MVTKLGGTVDDSELLEGMVFDHKARPHNPQKLSDPIKTLTH